jgi:hypothetical protein
MKLLRFSCVSLAIVLGFLVIVASYGAEGRFTDMGDGSVRDNNSGLIWLKCGNCTDISGDAFYAAADWNYANDVAAPSLADGLCGLTDGSSEGDWRLPTTLEWRDFFFTCWMPLGYPNTIIMPTGVPCGYHITGAFCDLQWDHYYWSSKGPRWDGSAAAVRMEDLGGLQFPSDWDWLAKDERAFILPVRDP